MSSQNQRIWHHESATDTFGLDLQGLCLIFPVFEYLANTFIYFKNFILGKNITHPFIVRNKIAFRKCHFSVTVFLF